MEQRERLIELLKSPNKVDQLLQMGVDLGAYHDDGIEAMIADFLLANGVIVPPCKVGDILYRIVKGKVENSKRMRIGDATFSVCEFMVDKQYFLDDKISIFVKRIWNGEALAGYEHFTSSDVGEILFLTREDAEKALAERRGE